MYSLSLPPCESLTVEFKSDRERLSIRELVEAVVCLANSEGGELWLGVEDDGTPTGLHAEQVNPLHLAGLGGLVAARTSPEVVVSVTPVAVGGVAVARIAVPRCNTEVATTSGVCLRRRLKDDGTPECTPMLPYDRARRAARDGQADASAEPVAGATLDDLDPLERERLRQCVRQYGGDAALLGLDDETLDGALGLTMHEADGSRVPTLTGLLLVGREQALRNRVPTHEFAFRMLARDAEGFSEIRRFPLLKALDWLDTHFHRFNPARDIELGPLHVSVPRVNHGALREAVINALLHRDYQLLGAVQVRLDDEGLTISNPGGLVGGVISANLRTNGPRPRNRALADAMRRVGVVACSGHGVEKIYRGMLRFGRPEPDYRRSDSQNTVLRLATTNADAAFMKLVVAEEGRRGTPLPTDSLIALATLREPKRLTTEALAAHTQRKAAHARRTLDTLLAAGLVQAYGAPKVRTYALATGVYLTGGVQAADPQRSNISAPTHEQVILNHVRLHGRIRRSEVMDLCRLKAPQARDLLLRLKLAGHLELHGARRGAYYTLSTPENAQAKFLDDIQRVMGGVGRMSRR